jgi:hypothetical protein
MVLRKAATLCAALEREQDLRPEHRTKIGMTRRSVINSAKVMGYLPKDIRTLAAQLSEADILPHVQQPYTRTYFQQRVPVLRNLLNTSEDYLGIYNKAQELGRQIREWQEEPLKKADQKRARAMLGQVEHIVCMTGDRYSYGFPSSPQWTFELQSSSEAREDLVERIESYGGEDKPYLQYLIDETHQSHPQWILYLVGTGGMAPVFIPVGNACKPYHLHTSRGNVRSDVHRVRIGEVDARFKHEPGYAQGFRKDLTAYLRSEEFRDRTGYAKVIITGAHTVRKEEFESLQWKKFFFTKPPKLGMDGIYGLHLTHPQTTFDLAEKQLPAPSYMNEY